MIQKSVYYIIKQCVFFNESSFQEKRSCFNANLTLLEKLETVALLVFEKINKEINFMLKNSFNSIKQRKWKYEALVIGNALKEEDIQILFTMFIPPVDDYGYTIVKTANLGSDTINKNIEEILKEISTEIKRNILAEKHVDDFDYCYLLFEKDALTLLVNILFQCFQLKEAAFFTPENISQNKKIFIQIKSHTEGNTKKIDLLSKEVVLSKDYCFEKINEIIVLDKSVSSKQEPVVFVNTINNFSTALSINMDLIFLSLWLHDKKNNIMFVDNVSIQIETLVKKFTTLEGFPNVLVIPLLEKDDSNAYFRKYI